MEVQERCNNAIDTAEKKRRGVNTERDGETHEDQEKASGSKDPVLSLRSAFHNTVIEWTVSIVPARNTSKLHPKQEKKKRLQLGILKDQRLVIHPLLGRK